MTNDLKKLVLIEDDDDVRTVAKAALEMVGGFTVRACGSGAEGLAAIAEFHPQLVLLDLMMPAMDGLEVLARLRARPETAELPVVFLTARAQTHEIEKLHESGAQGVIVKPFDPMTLADEIRSLWKNPV